MFNESTLSYLLKSASNLTDRTSINYKSRTNLNILVSIYIHHHILHFFINGLNHLDSQ